MTIQLVPDAQDRPVLSTSIRAMYSIDGNPIGLAVRSVALVRSAELLASAPAQPPAPGVDLSLPAGQVAPDLTVRIERAESEASGGLLVQLLAADPTIDMPDAPIRIDIGGDPAADLRRIVDEMQEVEGRPTQFVALRGIGLTIAEQLPIEFWNALSRIAARTGTRPPSILFLSAEPYVPWELAVVDPPLDPDLPPFLAAQATVGRWVLGQRRPALPPPMSVAVQGVAAVSGVYELPGWQRLAEAEAEAADIVRVYEAMPVDATIGGILDLLRGRPAADVIHFAVHGTYEAEEARDGLILVDGSALDPLAVKGIPLRGHPFVFLNACQVGRGSQLLGDHAGLAAAFLFAGAAGVIAPLWSIDDRLARDIAIRFYERAMRGEAPAEIDAHGARRVPRHPRDDIVDLHGLPVLRASRPAAGAGGRLTVSAGVRSRPGRASARRRPVGSRDWACAAPEPVGGCGAAASRRAARGAVRTSPFATSERAKARACTAASPSDEVTSPRTPVIDRPRRVVATRAMPGTMIRTPWSPAPSRGNGRYALTWAISPCRSESTGVISILVPGGTASRRRSSGAAPARVCLGRGTGRDVAGAGSVIP